MTIFAAENLKTLKLADIELVVNAPLLQQLPMRSPLNNPAVIDDQQ
jgi:hypothetical protein